jgi:CRP-like cAMP-binding protein
VHRWPLELMAQMLDGYVALSAEDRQAVLDLPFTLRELDAHTYIMREGEAPESCAVLARGFAYRHKISGDGGRQILSLHIPGDALDLQHLHLNIADHNIQTLVRSTVAFVPRVALQAIAQERPAVCRAIFISVAVEASMFREWILNVGRRSGRRRVAHVLCEFAARLQHRGLAEELGYELPMTQEQLGDATGLTPVHVNRMLKDLERDGLLTRSGRYVSFENWHRLQHEADFQGRYLHFDQSR